MLPYLIRRLAWGLLVLWGVSLITFVAAYLVPADPARNIGGIHATAAALANIRHQYGLDRPLPVQYLDYLRRLIRGNLGRSYSVSEDVLPAVLSRLPATGILAGAGLLFELAIGLPLGVLSATRPGAPRDKLAVLAVLIGFSLPPFVLGNVLLLLFAFHWTLFPLGGADNGLLSLWLPALTLGLGGAAWYARLLRATMVDVMRSDYIRTARAKGCGPVRVIVRHALRNAAGPVVTQIGLDLGYFLGGVVVVENVFAWPGIGTLAYDAIAHDDINLVMGTVLVAAIFVVLANIAADAGQALLDPRVRLE